MFIFSKKISHEKFFFLSRKLNSFSIPPKRTIVYFAEQRGIVPPTIVEYTSHVSVAQDEGAVLLCIAQGCPALDYRFALIMFSW